MSYHGNSWRVLITMEGVTVLIRVPLSTSAQPKFQREPLAKEELPPRMSGGGWQEGEQGLPGLPDERHNRGGLPEGHRGALPEERHRGGGPPPPYSPDHGQGDVHRGRGAYPDGQGDIQRFLEDVEASGKPRYISRRELINTKFPIQGLNTFTVG